LDIYLKELKVCRSTFWLIWIWRSGLCRLCGLLEWTYAANGWI